MVSKAEQNDLSRHWAVRTLAAIITSFFGGGLAVMFLTSVLFPVFNHPGLSYWISAVVGLWLRMLAELIAPAFTLKD